MDVRRKLAASLAGVMVLTGLSVATAPVASASTTVGGWVTCLSGNFVEGVYFDATSGSDGWAHTTYPGNTQSSQQWSYTLTSGTTYKLDVGCGGTPSNWATSLQSVTLSGTGHELICYDVAYEDPYYGSCR